MHNHNSPWSWIWADVDKCLVGLSEFGCLMRCCGRLPESTNYPIWLNSCCFVRFCSGNWSKCVFACDSSHRWASGAEYRSEHPPLTSLQAWLFFDARTASPEGLHVWCITCKHTIVNFTIMTALPLPGTAASQNIFGTQRQRWDTDFLSFVGINILTNQYQKVTFFPPLARPWLRQKRNCGKGKAGHFFPV